MQNLAACKKGNLRFLTAISLQNGSSISRPTGYRGASPPEQSKTPKDLSFGVLARFRVKLERKSHSCTNVGNIAEILVAVEVAPVDKDADVIGEAIFKTASDISVTVDIPIPRSATAHQYIGSEVPGANGIAQEEVSASGQWYAVPPLSIPQPPRIRYRSIGRRRNSGQIHHRSRCGIRLPWEPKNLGVKGIHLKLKIAESAGWFGDDDRLYFLIRTFRRRQRRRKVTVQR